MNAPADPIAAQRLTLRAPAPFELRVVAFGHGWIDLPPYRWDDARNAIVTVLDVGTASAPLPADVVVTAPRGQVVRAELRAARSLSARHVARAERTLHSMLRLEQDLAPFYAQCTAYPRLRWACVRGAGRLLRGATVFEDLLKLLFTTNCSWAATKKMTERTVALLGTPAPSGGRAFPSAAQCAEANASFWRGEVRAGYRDTACAGLAESFASGKLSEAWFTDPDVPTEELRRRLLTIRGFGPYAAGQALRLLGHYDDLALDAWCRARFAELAGKKKPPSDKTIARGYRGFGRYAGLALWLDLTRAWHEPAGDRSPLLA
jgi:N-glycosylase/DNA lyase